jgi:hypothetical protein
MKVNAKLGGINVKVSRLFWGQLCSNLVCAWHCWLPYLCKQREPAALL